MTTLQLKRMRLENFKGFREKEVTFGEHVTEISGRNGSGKSTLADAFFWTLFNKDAAGNAPGSDSFREKPLNDEGAEKHNLDTSVELDFTLNGERFDIKRVQHENWTKKRGQAETVYAGNVSTYYINGVEMKKTDFDARIKDIAGEDIFRMTATLSAFNAIGWKERRALLLDLTDVDVDGALFARDEYRAVADECAERNVNPDDLLKALKDERKRMNDELKMLPVRLDEAQKSIPQFKPHELEDAEYMVRQTTEDIKRLDALIADTIATGDGADRQRKLMTLEADLVNAKRWTMQEYDTKRRELNSKLNLAGMELDTARNTELSMKAKLTADTKALEQATKVRDALRQKFVDTRSKPLPTVNENCPYCGQTLPADKVEEAKVIAVENVRAELRSIQENGKAAAQNVTNYEILVQQDKEQLDGQYRLIEKLEAAWDEAKKNFEAVKEPDFSENESITDIEAQIAAIKAEGASSSDTKLKALQARRVELVQTIDRNRAVIARKESVEYLHKRVKELEDRQVEVGNRLTETENLIVTVERFIADRCGVLEESINAKFPTVRWKLFNQQINGGIEDTCICMIPCVSGLVTYGSANTASQINADIEIVNVLSDYYELRLPLFVDNKERVNVLTDTDTQLITLSVSTDEELKVVAR